MKNIKSIFCVLLFVCTIAGAYAKPSKTKGKTAICNPDAIVVPCDIDTTTAEVISECPDGEYYARVCVSAHTQACRIDLYVGDFSEHYFISYGNGIYSPELLEKLDAFTYCYMYGKYRAALMITMKNSHIVKIRSDDPAWDTYSRWVYKTFYGKDGYALIN